MSDEQPKIRVLIVDDHTVVRTGLCRLLTGLPDIEVIADTEFGEEAIQIVKEQAPDVVLLDLKLETSQIDGQETLRQITAWSPSTHVVVLSAYSDDEFMFPALFDGAIGYLLKHAHPAEVIEAIRGAARGYYHLDALIVQKIIERLRAGPAEHLPDQPPADDALTERERQLLPLLARGLTNAEIAEQLTISHSTVKTHVSNVLRKLGISSRREVLLAMAERHRQAA